MCVYTQGVDGVLHGTEALEQNNVSLHTRSTDDLNVLCKEERQY